MKRFFTNLVLVGAVVLSGCTVTELPNDTTIEEQSPVFMAYFAEQEQDNQTRTFINDKIQLRWHSEDLITLYVGNTLNQKFMFAGEDGDNSGYFEQVSMGSFGTGNPLDNNYAIYPYSAKNKISEEGEMTVTIPTSQTYAPNTFGKGANVMVSVTNGTSDTFLGFRNVCGYLRVRLYGVDQRIKSVKFQSKGGVVLSGSATVTPEYGGNPTCVMKSGGNDYVELSSAEGVVLSESSESPTCFWLVVPPVTLSSGFTITITGYYGDSVELSSNSAFTIERNKYYSFTREMTLSSEGMGVDGWESGGSYEGSAD